MGREQDHVVGDDVRPMGSNRTRVPIPRARPRRPHSLRCALTEFGGLGCTRVYSIVGVYIATTTVRPRGVVTTRLATGAIGLVAFWLLTMLVIPTSNWAAGRTYHGQRSVLARLWPVSRPVRHATRKLKCHDCATVREDGRTTDRSCLIDALGLEDVDDLDTSLVIETVDEDGGRRVRIVPTFTDLMGRLLDVFDDRQSLLYAFDSPQLDDATIVEAGSDIDIEFDGQLYVVNEFEISAGEAYNVTGSEGTRFDLYVDDGFGLEQRFGDDFVAAQDGVARVVTYSDIDDDQDCGVIGCLPTGRGDATIRIREAGRQAVPFPQRITGDFGPGDIRVFELEVETAQVVRIDVEGAFVGSDLVDGFLYRIDDDTYDLPAGTYDLVVYNFSGDDSTTYDVVPSSG